MPLRDPTLQPLPSNIELIPSFDAVIIRRKWRSMAAFFLIIFSLFWNGFMVVWMSIALTQGEWLMAAFGSLHAVIGIGLLYFTAASLVNRTDIRIDSNLLSISHRPLPWFGQKQVSVLEIKQVYCKERIRRGKNSTSVTYDVLYLDQNQRESKLLSGLKTSPQATFIESEIENVLGIENQSVRGEY